MQVALKSSEKFASSIQVCRLSLPQRDCIVLESDVLSQVIVLFQLVVLSSSFVRIERFYSCIVSDFFFQIFLPS